MPDVLAVDVDAVNDKFSGGGGRGSDAAASSRVDIAMPQFLRYVLGGIPRQ